VRQVPYHEPHPHLTSAFSRKENSYFLSPSLEYKTHENSRLLCSTLGQLLYLPQYLAEAGQWGTDFCEWMSSWINQQVSKV
jgi:hypothetical protein